MFAVVICTLPFRQGEKRPSQTDRILRGDHSTCKALPVVRARKMVHRHESMHVCMRACVCVNVHSCTLGWVPPEAQPEARSQVQGI